MAMILPGGTIGILGGGQLGRMFAMAARQMAYKVVVFSPETDSPAGAVADLQIQAEFDDASALSRFSEAVDVASIEFENIPVETLELIERHIPVRPGADSLRLTQNRLDEKNFLSNGGFPVAPFRRVLNEADIQKAIPTPDEFPAVLKTAASGYDGKGQRMVYSAGQLREAWSELDEVECVLERFINFDCEFSVIVARNSYGQTHYEPIRNHHRNHILDVSSSPSNLPAGVCEAAIAVARGVADSLNYIGIMCIEFFLRNDGEVIINEIAPRPHNSGHLTIEAHATSQFEQQVRAVCELPLGSTLQRQPAAMANILGDVWDAGIPSWTDTLSIPNVGLHLYGKDEPRAGRKMGHLTCLADSSAAAIALAGVAMSKLQRKSAGEQSGEVDSMPGPNAEISPS